MAKPIIHLRWNEKYIDISKVLPSVRKYLKKYGKQRTLCWLAPSIKKEMTDKPSEVTCKRCIASFKGRGITR